MNEEKQAALEAVLKPENQHEAIALARALCPFAPSVTDAQMLICIALVEAKGDVKSVAEYLGYEIGRVRSHLQFRLAGKIIRELSRQKLSGEGYAAATGALMDIAGSAGASPAARNKAAKTIVDMVEEQNKDGSGDDDGPDLNTMTLKQLEAFVERVKGDLIGISAPMAAVEQA